MKYLGALLFILFSQSLLCSYLCSGEEQQWHSVDAVEMSPGFIPHIYEMPLNRNMKVCPAFSPAGDYAKVAVRAPGGYPGGRFNVSQLPDQFSVAYTKTCRSFVLYWPTICEHLLVRAVSPINVTGHFSIRYITADGSKYFERKVHYGPLGISYRGDGDDVVTIDSEDSLSFVQRSPVNPGYDPITVCEQHAGDEDFRPSHLLQLMSPRRVVPSCAAALGFPGGFSRLYKFSIGLIPSTKPSELTERRIKVVLGGHNCNSLDVLPSQEITVVGVGHNVLDLE